MHLINSVRLTVDNPQKLKASKASYKSYKEVNNIKPLCADEVSYNNLCSFIDALSSFYEYE